MRRVKISNKELLADVVELLNVDRVVTIRVKGNSMLPLIRGGRDSVELKKFDNYNLGNIVLAEVTQGVYVIHRIIEMQGHRVVLMGDGNIREVEECTIADIRAKVIAIITPVKRKECTEGGQRRFFRFWSAVKPLRRYILAIYRRVIL